MIVKIEKIFGKETVIVSYKGQSFKLDLDDRTNNAKKWYKSMFEKMVEIYTNDVGGCYWCDNPLVHGQVLEVLPDNKGVAHENCAEEYYASKIAED